MTLHLSPALLERYEDVDPVHIPLYGFSAASAYLDIPTSTLRAWCLGQDNFAAVLALPDPDLRLLSFTNLTECHVLRSLRSAHRRQLPEIRRALGELQGKTGNAHPLATLDFYKDNKDLWVRLASGFVNVSNPSQLSLFETSIDQHLKCIVYQEQVAVALSPLRHTDDGEKPTPIQLDIRVAYGSPCIKGTDVPVEAVISRLRAQERVPSIARDFRISRSLVEEVLTWALLQAA
jgi:uncharacterized protein (DUF433 family)